MIQMNDAEAVYIRALVGELKILIHLGKHVNIVNLLGACTETIASGNYIGFHHFSQALHSFKYIINNTNAKFRPLK